MMKRLVLCFDGSWNKLTADYPTNVVLTAESVVPTAPDGTAQVIFYDEGVGTERFQKVSGGMFGAGLVKNMADAYRFLIFNYTPGDEIYVFGFSRGAFTARSFVGLIFTVGILQRAQANRADEAIEMYQQRDETPGFAERMMEFRKDCSPQICVSDQEDAWRASNIPNYVQDTTPQLSVQYVGVWDTVGALGLPDYLFEQLDLDRKYEFHDHELNQFVEHARHAVAIDERRVDFKPTLWSNVDNLTRDRQADPEADDAPYQQKWFPGNHGSVGGGADRRGLSDHALEWIWDGARNAGLLLDTSPSSRIYELGPSYREFLDNSSTPPELSISNIVMGALPRDDRKPGPQSLYEVRLIARRRWHEAPENLPEGEQYRPATLSSVAGALDALDPRELGVAMAQIEMPAGTFKVHEVKRGDNLTGIAQRYYGDRNQFTRIVEANRDKIWDPDLIYAGQTIRIPNP